MSILSPVLYAHGTHPHHQPLEMAPQLLSLGHPVGLVTIPEPDDVSHHTGIATVGFPAPALLKETGEMALFLSEPLFPPGGTGRGSCAGEN